MDKNIEQMEQLRELVLGKDNSRITQTMRLHAREIVSEVFSEALHDREKKDESVGHVIQPLVEESVESSVSQHSEQFISYLYPLVGRLVRKSVANFIGEFLEKTNELLENSLTFKGLSWRYKAWRAGISYAQYVAAQTFVYRVDQILLIHYKTGILLNSVHRTEFQSADADLVSSMLTAINDFVGDSFRQDRSQTTQHLDVVKTDDFTLLIKVGPQAIIVAAITGDPPMGLHQQLQEALEFVHHMYSRELQQFSGDTVPFENSEATLRKCLLAEFKPEAQGNKKRPWLAIALVAMASLAGLWYLSNWWQQQRLMNTLNALPQQSGILLADIRPIGLNRVNMSVLRDPDAVSVSYWLEQQGIDTARVTVNERGYRSLDNDLLQSRMEKALEPFESISLTWQNGQPSLHGRLPNQGRQALAQTLRAIPGLTSHSQLLEDVEIEEVDTANDDDPTIMRAILDLNMAKIDNMQIEFASGSSELTRSSLSSINQLAEHFRTAVQLANKLDLSIGLIIMGASDPSGSRELNQALSLRRARVVQRHLIEIGIDAGYLNAIGLGVVADQTSSTGARKVLFNVIYFGAED